MANVFDQFDTASTNPYDRFDEGAKPAEGDFGQGLKRSFAQVPELAYGAAALTAVTAENLLGAGGFSTAAKDYFAQKYNAKKTENQQYAPAVEFTDAWANLKSGNLGSMVDWLQDSAGYVIGQAGMTVATGGVGSMIGKKLLQEGLETGVKAGAETFLGGVVAKQAAKIAEETAVKQGLGEAAVAGLMPGATKLAAERVAQALGAGVALSAQNLGMEAGDIYGGLVEESDKSGKPITGEDLVRAWGAAAVAAGTETATDLLGLGALAGRIKIGGTQIQGMTGIGGRAARAGTAAAVGAPIEGAQEYVQTGLEQFGAGKPLGTLEAEKERINAMAVGALGGTIVGGGIGAVTSPILEAKTPDEAIEKFKESVTGTTVDTGSLLATSRANIEALEADAKTTQEQLNEATRALSQAQLVHASRGYGEVIRTDSGEFYVKNNADESIPLALADEASVPAGPAIREHYAALGQDVVFYRDNPSVSDGAFDADQPNTLFLSDNPSRNIVEIAAHEAKHAMEDLDVGGVRANDILVDAILRGATDEGTAYAFERFAANAPAEAAEDATPEAKAAASEARARFVFNELAADIAGEAPKFEAFMPKVFARIEAEYGRSVAGEMLKKFIDGIKTAYEAVRKFFGPEDTRSQKWVSNLEEVHGILEGMYVRQYGTQIEKEQAKLDHSRAITNAEKLAAEAKNTAEVDVALREGRNAAAVDAQIAANKAQRIEAVLTEHKAALKAEREARAAEQITTLAEQADEKRPTEVKLDARKEAVQLELEKLAERRTKPKAAEITSAQAAEKLVAETGAVLGKARETPEIRKTVSKAKAEFEKLKSLKKVKQSPKATVNIGLSIPGGGEHTPAEARLVVKAHGIKPTRDFIKDVTYPSNGQLVTERSLVLELDEKPDPAVIEKIRKALKQEAISEYDHVAGTAYLHGEDRKLIAKNYGEPNTDYIYTADGESITEVLARGRKGVVQSPKEKTSGVRLSQAQHEASSSSFLYGGRLPYQVANQTELGEVLQDQATTYALPRTEDTDENREFVAGVLEHEVRLALQNATDGHAAIGWYDHMIDKSRASASLLYPELAENNDAWFAFTYILAVTSNGHTIRENVQNAFEQYSYYRRNKNGHMAVRGYGIPQNAMKIAFQRWNQAIDEVGLPEYREFLLDKHPVTTLKKIAPSVKEIVEQELYGGTIIGSKIGGGFLPNMNKRFDALTMDRWFMRTWGRATGHLVEMQKEYELDEFNERTGKFTEQLGLINDPKTGGNRYYIRGTLQQVLESLQKEYPTLTMADMQAVLWYEEKALYTMHNVNNEEATDYDTEIADFVQGKGIKRRDIENARALAGQPAGRDAGDQRGGAAEAPAVQQSPKSGGEATGQDRRGVDVTQTPEFKRWFGDSKVVDENGGPMPVSHWSPNKFNIFAKTTDLGYHFGTLAAAEDRAALVTENYPKPETIRSFYLSIRNPLTLDDTFDSGITSAQDTLQQLRAMGEISLEDYEATLAFSRDKNVSSKAVWDRVRTLITDQGYDGVTYSNGSEDEGEMSWIAFRPEQIKSATGNTGAFDPKNPDIRFSPKDAVTVTGVHFSQDKRAVLDGRFYGQGVKGAEFARLRGATDPRILRRTYFYVNKGNGIRPEKGVGAHAHRAELTNLYDLSVDPLALHPTGDVNALESAILDAGYSGYLAREAGAAVLLGSGAYLTPEYLGTGKEAYAAILETPPARYSEKQQKALAIAGDKLLPAGQRTGAEWAELVPEAAGKLEPRKTYFKDQVARAIMQSPKDQTQTPEFKRWFGDSKVVDKDGKPLVVYHGTGDDFSEFDLNQAGRMTGSMTGALFFSSDPVAASGFAKLAKMKDRSATPNVIPAYLSLQNPLIVIRDKTASPQLDERLKYEMLRKAFDDGNDGVIFRDFADKARGGRKRADIFAAFRPEQIKSATGNTGAFDPGNPDIRFSPKVSKEQKDKARALGFDTSRVWYRYDTEDYDEIRGNPNGLHLGAMHFASNPKGAEGRFNDVRAARADANVAPGYPTYGEGGRGPVGFTGAYWLKAKNPYRLRDLGVWNPTDVLREIQHWFGASPLANSESFGSALELAEDWEENSNAENETKKRIAANEAIWSLLSEHGYDSIKYRNTFEGGTGIMVPRGDQVRAITAAFEKADSSNVMASPKIVGDSLANYTPAQRAAMRRTGLEVDEKSLPQKIQALRANGWQKIKQGLFDQFDPIKDISKAAYTLARLSKGTAGAFEALLKYGKLTLRDNAYDGDTSGGFVAKVLIPLHGETTRFLTWVAAKRAELLKRQDREHLFSDEDIRTLKTLAGGQTNYDYTLANGTTTRDRAKIFEDSLTKYAAFNKNILDIAQASGLVDPATRKEWEQKIYVPFFRVSEEDGKVTWTSSKSGLANQAGIKHLKGGTEKLNADLLANVLQNWYHLLDASAKNRAAKATLEAAVNVNGAYESDAATTKEVAKSLGMKDARMWFMDEGKQRFFVVQDPMLVSALSSLDFHGLRGPIMDGMSFFKHALTVGVTASPFFKVRNLIRDSVQAAATSDISYNLAGNLKSGFALTERGTQDYVSMLASGGLIRFGTMLEAREGDRVRQLTKEGIAASTLLTDQGKLDAVWTKIKQGVEAYNELGNRGEEINRAALYKQLTAKGFSHAEAALAARDLLDFSMQGSWTSVRFLTQLVPFMNARLQGIYKLGRATAEDRARMAIMVGAVTLLSLTLLAAGHDDDDWKKRTDADRNSWWWFKFAGVAYRIPKPFEIGAIATLAERGWEYFTDPEMTGTRLGQNVTKLLGDQLAMNPIPQAFKPIIDVYANTDSFTGAPIESMGMERLQPEYRYRASTSMAARGASTAALGALSPVQVEHLTRAYFGWLGSFVLGSADLLARPLTGQGERPDRDLWKFATGNMIATLPEGQSRYVDQVYKQAQVLEQAMGTYRDMLKRGDKEGATEFLAENKDKLARYRSVEYVKKAESLLNERIRLIEASSKPGAEKRTLIQALTIEKDRRARALAPM